MSQDRTMNMSELSIRTITYQDYHLTKDFKCENSSIEQFLRTDAYYSTINKEASTSLVFHNENLVGFFTLNKSKLAIDIDEESDIDLEELTTQDCLFIARLGVRTEYKENGIGSWIIKKIIEIASMVNERFIALDALIERYRWYEKRGFSHLIESEIIESNSDGLVYMILDLYDEKLIDEYFETAV
ncbi:GNAT family N-acetyltransferase [Lederbergia lenta]|uniref:GNAT family N-acetyltransferase n=1 Tax=Lederbergia lenta TaxID=1467 RepID=UPI0020415681|nr:GNAT family N-acetyltransferase [Lederbergia lenta]MCM3110043.1 GNAT family N-acetyltransferase [Lederbergia lenta]